MRDHPTRKVPPVNKPRSSITSLFKTWTRYYHAQGVSIRKSIRLVLEYMPFYWAYLCSLRAEYAHYDQEEKDGVLINAVGTCSSTLQKYAPSNRGMGLTPLKRSELALVESLVATNQKLTREYAETVVGAFHRIVLAGVPLKRTVKTVEQAWVQVIGFQDHPHVCKIGFTTKDPDACLVDYRRCGLGLEWAYRFRFDDLNGARCVDQTVREDLCNARCANSGTEVYNLPPGVGRAIVEACCSGLEIAYRELQTNAAYLAG